MTDYYKKYLKYKKKYLNLSNRKLDLIIGGMGGGAPLPKQINQRVEVPTNIQLVFEEHKKKLDTEVVVEGVYVTALRRESQNGDIFLVEYPYKGGPEELLFHFLLDAKHDAREHSPQMTTLLGKERWETIKVAIMEKVKEKMIKANRKDVVDEKKAYMDVLTEAQGYGVATFAHVKPNAIREIQGLNPAATVKQHLAPERWETNNETGEFFSKVEEMYQRQSDSGVAVDAGPKQLFSSLCSKIPLKDLADLISREDYKEHNDRPVVVYSLQMDGPTPFSFKQYGADPDDQYVAVPKSSSTDRYPRHYHVKKVKKKIDFGMIHNNLDSLIISIKIDNHKYSFISESYIVVDNITEDHYIKTRTLLAVDGEILGYILCNGVITDIYKHTGNLGVPNCDNSSYLKIYLYRSGEEAEEPPPSPINGWVCVPAIIVEFAKTCGDFGQVITVLKSERDNAPTPDAPLLNPHWATLDAYALVGYKNNEEYKQICKLEFPGAEEGDEPLPPPPRLGDPGVLARGKVKLTELESHKSFHNSTIGVYMPNSLQGYAGDNAADKLFREGKHGERWIASIGPLNRPDINPEILKYLDIANKQIKERTKLQLAKKEFEKSPINVLSFYFELDNLDEILLTLAVNFNKLDGKSKRMSEDAPKAINEKLTQIFETMQDTKLRLGKKDQILYDLLYPYIICLNKQNIREKLEGDRSTLGKAVVNDKPNKRARREKFLKIFSEEFIKVIDDEIEKLNKMYEAVDVDFPQNVRQMIEEFADEENNTIMADITVALLNYMRGNDKKEDEYEVPAMRDFSPRSPGESESRPVSVSGKRNRDQGVGLMKRRAPCSPPNGPSQPWIPMK